MKLDEWIRRPLQRALKLQPSDYDIPFADNIVRRGDGKSSMVMGYRDTADGRYRGTARISFTRLNFSTLFLNNPPSIEAYGINNLHDLLPIVEEKYGLYIPKTDVQNFVFDKWSLPRTITIQTTPNSALYDGSVELQVNVKPMALDEIITVLDHDGIVDPLPRSNPKMIYQLRYYGFDFTEFRDEILSYNVGYAYGQGSCAVINRLNTALVRAETGGPSFEWYISTTGHCAYLMSCIYRGPTEGYAGANTRYKYVSVWRPGRLNEPEAKGTGVLLLHYD